MTLKKVGYIILIIIALVMIYMGYENGIMPPTLTGIGFIIVGLIGLSEAKKG
jgi:predicted tellurium resistance membrane protein TerC